MDITDLILVQHHQQRRMFALLDDLAPQPATVRRTRRRMRSKITTRSVTPSPWPPITRAGPKSGGMQSERRGSRTAITWQRRSATTCPTSATPTHRPATTSVCNSSPTRRRIRTAWPHRTRIRSATSTNTADPERETSARVCEVGLRGRRLLGVNPSNWPWGSARYRCGSQRTMGAVLPGMSLRIFAGGACRAEERVCRQEIEPERHRIADAFPSRIQHRYGGRAEQCHP